MNGNIVWEVQMFRSCEIRENWISSKFEIHIRC